MLTFLLLFQSLVYSDSTCVVKDVLINNGVDFCATFSSGEKKVCVSGHTHLLPETGASLRIAVTRMATGQNAKANKAEIEKWLNSQEVNRVHTHFINQLGHLVNKHFDKKEKRNLALYGEGGPTEFARHGAVDRQLKKLKGKLSDEQYQKLRLVLLGPAFEANKQFPTRFPPGVPSESESRYTGCDGTNVKKCLDKRDGPMAEKVFRCKKKKCYWFGGGAHVAGMKKWFEKQCKVSAFSTNGGHRRDRKKRKPR